MIVKIDTDKGDCGLIYNDNSMRLIMPPFEIDPDNLKDLPKSMQLFMVFSTILNKYDPLFDKFINENSDYYAERVVDNIIGKAKLIDKNNSNQKLRLVKNEQ